jgi:hypothetical protein
MLNEKKSGRPKQYKSKLRKSITNEVKPQTVAYNNARQRLPKDLITLVYDGSKNFGNRDNESWHGMRTYITDGTYLQPQDTEDINESYPTTERGGSYPQALLQVPIRQGGGQVWDYALGNRKMSELELAIPMLENLESGSLLLADDLYNCYYHFWLILKHNSHMIVPGKRMRNYTVIEKTTDTDLIVRITKGNRPDYVSEEAWKEVPQSLILRRITYEYPTKNGMETAVLYTTITDKEIDAVSIVQKYEKRWNIEISINASKSALSLSLKDLLTVEINRSLVSSNSSYENG